MRGIVGGCHPPLPRSSPPAKRAAPAGHGPRGFRIRTPDRPHRKRHPPNRQGNLRRGRLRRRAGALHRPQRGGRGHLRGVPQAQSRHTGRRFLRRGHAHPGREHEVRRRQGREQVQRRDGRRHHRRGHPGTAHPREHRQRHPGPASAGMPSQEKLQTKGEEGGDGRAGGVPRRSGIPQAVRRRDLREGLDREPLRQERAVRAQDPVQARAAGSAAGRGGAARTRGHGQAGPSLRVQARQHLPGRGVYLHVAAVRAGRGVVEFDSGRGCVRWVAGERG
mmetsp:Transcript_3293/g.7328  ORF Transcript_3293/g.7328 Transcript_3293/m.7328 type:complete len:277 (-) Transcript_3293:840-1670(-)